MKPNRTKLFAACLLAAVIAALALPAQAQVTSTRLTSALTNDMTLTVPNGTLSLSSPTNLIVDIPQGKDLGLWCVSSNLAAGASNSTITVEVTPDGTNWITSPTFTMTYVHNGTTAVSCATNWAAASVVNYRKARIKSIATTALSNNIVTKLYFLRQN